MTTDQIIFVVAIAAVVLLALAWRRAPRTNKLMRLFMPGRGAIGFGEAPKTPSRSADEN